MDAQVEAVLADYEARLRREMEGFAALKPGDPPPERDDLLLAVGPQTGRLMNELIKAAGARTIVELGTSYGYSGIWLAEAAQATGGRVISFDVAAEKQAYAREALRKAGLDGVVEHLTGDATALLEGFEGPIDFVLLDIWKDLYVPCLELFFPKLAPGAIVVADNMLRPAEARADALAYRRAVRAKPGISSVLLPIGSGLEISRLAGPQDEGL